MITLAKLDAKIEAMRVSEDALWNQLKAVEELHAKEIEPMNKEWLELHKALAHEKQRRELLAEMMEEK